MFYIALFSIIFIENIYGLIYFILFWLLPLWSKSAAKWDETIFKEIILSTNNSGRSQTFFHWSRHHWPAHPLLYLRISDGSECWNWGVGIRHDRCPSPNWRPEYWTLADFCPSVFSTCILCPVYSSARKTTWFVRARGVMRGFRAYSRQLAATTHNIRNRFRY